VRARSSAVLALVVITLGGCTSKVPGVADPVVPPSSGVDLPVRAKELSLRGVDPCTLLTPPQLTELKENGAPRLVSEDSRRDGPTCAFDVDAAKPTYTYFLEVITDADVQDWLTGNHHKTSMTQEPVPVPGFPALVNYAPSQGVQDCETLVGVAEGQTLRAQMAPDDTSFTQRQLCDMSTNVAKLAIQTLEAGAPK
jgi:Protein of unknown function (DUF3558)